MDERLLDLLAAYAHEAWSGWMQYLFDRSNGVCTDGTVIIPADLVARWQRQLATPYAELSKAEQESDRVEARRMLAIMRPTIQPAD